MRDRIRIKRTKASNLAYRILLWLSAQGFYTSLTSDLLNDKGARYFNIESQAKSFRIVHRFMKQFKQFGTFKKTESASEGCLNYVCNQQIGEDSINVKLYAIRELPNTCQLVEETVTIPEQVIPEHIEPEHVETRMVVKCSDDSELEPVLETA